MKIRKHFLAAGTALAVLGATAALAAIKSEPYYEKLNNVWVSMTFIGKTTGSIDIPKWNTYDAILKWNTDYGLTTPDYDNYIGGMTWGYDKYRPANIWYTIRAKNIETKNKGSLFFGAYGWSCGAGSNNTEDVEFYIVDTFWDDDGVPYGTRRVKNANGTWKTALSGGEIYDFYVTPEKKQIGGKGAGTACSPVDGQGRPFWQVWAVRRTKLALSVGTTRQIKFAQIFSVMKTVRPMKDNLKYYGTFLEVGEGTRGSLRFTTSKN